MKVGVETWNSETLAAMCDAATPAAARGMLEVHGREDAGGAGGGGAWMRERGAEARFALNAHFVSDVHGPRAGAAGAAVS